APATIARLERVLPAAARAANPLDYTALLWDDTGALKELVLALGDDPGVGHVLVLYDDAGGGDAAWAAVLDPVKDAGARSAAPRAVASTLPELLDDGAALSLAEAGMPALAGLRSGLRAVRARLAPPPDPERIAAIKRERRARPGRWLEEHEAK